MVGSAVSGLGSFDLHIFTSQWPLQRVRETRARDRARKRRKEQAEQVEPRGRMVCHTTVYISLRVSGLE